MITHVVLFEVIPENKGKICELLEQLGNLRYSTITQIKSFSYGENNSPEGLSKNYNYGFTMQFLSSVDRDYYLSHPDHINIAKQLVNLLINGLDSVLVFDY